jgi:energy-coupling factor transporter ATP-binding protein EcfA2
MSSIQEKINKSTEEKVFFNPFPGLRPFSVEESHLFFGREGQSDEVIHHLSKNKFIAVIGTSGSGKSSLIYCGVIPTLQGGFVSGAGNGDWKIIATKPGNNPIENLAESLLKATDKANLQTEDFMLEKSLTSAILSSSSLGLVDAVKRLIIKKNENVLLLIDQFEELFRFNKSKDDKDAYNNSYAFVKLILEAVKQSKVPIYVVITMRSDFIGDCAHFPELTDLINESNYLIPQMTRENVRQAILGPVAVGGGEISQHLVQQLLNDLGNNPDQLPILQHSLMRTWDYWSSHRNGNEPMSVEHYNAIGKMEKALSEHANEAFDELTEEEKLVCENVFKTLTEKGADNRGVRRPTKIKEIAQIALCSEQDVINIANKFRDSSLSFLTPSKSATPNLNENSIIDISHESLMRIWNRLIVWVDEESNAVNMYLRLADAANLFQQGKTGLWRPPDLQLALNWKEKKQPTLEWAQRFDPAFERAMEYLNTSSNTFEAEEQNKILLQKKALRRSRIFAIVLGSASIVSLGFLLYAVVLQQQAEKQRLIAEEQKVVAEEQKILAEKSAIEAEEQKALAQLSAEEAKIQAELAEQQKQLALEQQILAEKSAKEALIQKEFANLKSKEALAESEKAEKSAKEALSQKSLAEQASKSAYQLRMLSIAQSMAVKSKQLHRDENEKGLVALQAYQFNEQFGGNKHNADIYDGLYYTLKQINEASFNSLDGHTNSIRSIVFNQTGEFLYTTGSDGKIFRWNLKDNKKEKTIIYENNSINRCLALSENQEILACGNDNGNIEIHKAITLGSNPAILNSQHGIVHQLIFDKNNTHLYALTLNGNIIVWNIDKNTFNDISRANAKAKHMAYNTVNSTLIVGFDDGKIISIQTDNTENQKEIYEDKNFAINVITINKTGNQLAVGDMKGNVRLFDLTNNKIIQSLEGQSARITDLKYSDDGKLLASGSMDGSVNIWSTEDFFRQPFVLNDHNSWVQSISFSPDNQSLIAGCRDNLVRIWPTNTTAMANQICPKLTRNMTQEEWNRFVGEDIRFEETCKGLKSTSNNQ